MKKFVFLTAGTILLANPTFADDWSGLYVGVHGGSGSGVYTQGVSALDYVGVDVAVEGTIGGVTAGYNWNTGTFIYGFEADYSTGPNGVTPQGTGGRDVSCSRGDCNVSIDDFVTVRGRIGIETVGVLIYGTAGYATGNVTGGVYNSFEQGGGVASGWTAGVGAESDVFANTTAKLEYLHVDLGALPFGTGRNPDNTFDANGTFDVIRFGLNYQF